MNIRANYYKECDGTLLGTEAQKKAQIQSLEKTGQYVAQSKSDGIWSVSISDGKTLKLYSRNEKEKSQNLPVLPAGSVIIGEFGFGSQWATKKRKIKGYDFVECFDIVSLRGNSLKDRFYVDRHDILNSFLRNLPIPMQKHFPLLPYYTENFVELYEKEHEGIVIKKKTGLYTPFDNDWFRVKKELEEDMVIIGFEL